MSLGSRLLEASERRPEAAALVEGDLRLDYAGLLERARRVAGGLAGLGVGPGDRVATALRNRVETVLLYWASQWLGAWFVPLNWRLTPADVAYCVEDAGASVLAVEEVSAGVATLVPAGCGLVAIGPGCPGTPFEQLTSAEPAPGPAPVDEGEPAIMLYTSGTTGRPKGVPRSHRAEWASALAHVIQCRYVPGERTLGVMPLYHTMGMRSLLAMVAVDGCLVVQAAFRGSEALEAVADERISALYLAPTLFYDLLAAARQRPGGCPRVPRLAYAGAPMTAALVEACRSAFDPEVFVNHYGSTEIYTFSIGPDQVAKPGCAGRPGIHERLRLVAPEPGADPSLPVPPGEVGQVACHLSSPEAFTSYWHRPDADARALRDGWYLTGDLGRLDEDGDLWVLGRVDDMIITGGENVFPLEIEEVLATYPGVEDVAVVGLPDDRLGEKVVAFVVGRGVDADGLEAHCLASPALAPFKRPREYHFLRQLPKNASGKLLRARLRELVSAEPAGPGKRGDHDRARRLPGGA